MSSKKPGNNKRKGGKGDVGPSKEDRNDAPPPPPPGTTRPQAQPRREEQRASEPQRVAAASPRSEPIRDDSASPEPSAELVSFLAQVEEVGLPGEGVALWVKRSGEIAQFTQPEREAAWGALVKHVEKVGKMKNAKVWLKKAVEEERARAGAQAS